VASKSTETTAIQNDQPGQSATCKAKANPEEEHPPTHLSKPSRSIPSLYGSSFTAFTPETEHRTLFSNTASWLANRVDKKSEMEFKKKRKKLANDTHPAHVSDAQCFLHRL